MGVPVTVDSDDLEALLFATGAIEKIEFALQADRIDPQAQQGRRYAEARRRANGARLNATRVADGMLKPLDQVELCEADKRFLVEFANRGTTFIEGRNYSVAAFSRIRGESLIEIANTKRAEYWTSGQELNGVMPDGRVYLALRLTERGRMWLASHPELMKQIPARQMTPRRSTPKSSAAPTS
jgi:hypothetical protein